MTIETKYAEQVIVKMWLGEDAKAPSTFLFLPEDKYRNDRFDEWARSSVG